MRTLGRLLLLVAVLAAIVGVTMYRAPVWTARQVTHFSLFLSRIQSNYVLTPEGRVHYYEAEPRIAGGGVPLVLVHGLADRSEAWAPMMKRLKKAGFHVYAPDLLGYGRSPKPEDSDYSIATQEQFVVDFIKSLGLQKTDIGGWSMGGWVVLKLAVDHPDMVDRVVVYDSAGLTFPFKDTELFRPKEPEDVDRLFATMEPGQKLPLYVRRDVLRALQSQQWVVDRGMKSMLSGRDVLDNSLHSIGAPVLIIWGKNDQLTPVSIGQNMHGLLPNSELDILEGCGHLAPARCASRAASATADFLKADPLPQGSVRTLTHP